MFSNFQIWVLFPPILHLVIYHLFSGVSPTQLGKLIKLVQNSPDYIAYELKDAKRFKKGQNQHQQLRP